MAAALLLLVAAASAARASRSRLEERMVAAGFESVRAESTADVARVRFENRRFRDTGFALGVAAAIAADELPGRLEFQILRHGTVIAVLRFMTPDFIAFADSQGPAETFLGRLEVEPLPAHVIPVAAPVRSSASGHFDLRARLLFDSQFGHIQEPFDYHIEISPQLLGQPWPGSRIQLAWTFPLQHARDIPPDDTRPDYHLARPEESDVYQFIRLPGRGLANVGAGYFGGNRYGATAGVAWAAGPRWLLEGSADLTGAVVWRPDVTYSSVSRLTFTGAVTCHLSRPDLALTVRGGRYLYGTSPGSRGEYAMRVEANRRFRHTSVGLFGVKTTSNSFGGFRLGIPIPPSKRLAPSLLRPDLPTEFPFEYRTEEGLFQVPATDPRTRSALLEDYWPGAVREQLYEWLGGAAWARARARAGS